MDPDPAAALIVQQDMGPAEPVVADFDLVHRRHSLGIDLGNRFDDRLFGGEPSGQMQQASPLPRAGVRFFILRENPPHERGSAPRDRLAEPRELDHVHPAADRQVQWVLNPPPSSEFGVRSSE